MDDDRSGPARPPNFPRTIPPLVLPLLLIAWGVRLFAYAPGELGLDGYLSAGLALVPVDQALDFLARDVHPPLYYLTLKLWLAVAGVNIIAARWLSLAAGLLTLTLIYQLCRRLAGPTGALITLALLALAPAPIAASATARDFAPGLFASTATLLIWQELDRAASRRAQRMLMILLALATAGALGLWYFHALFVFLQLLDLALRRRDRKAAPGDGRPTGPPPFSASPPAGPGAIMENQSPQVPAFGHLPSEGRIRTGSGERFGLGGEVSAGRALALLIGCGVQLPWLTRTLPLLLSKLFQGTTFGGAPVALAPPRTVLAEVSRSLTGAFPLGWPHLGAASWALLILLGVILALRGDPVVRRWGRLTLAGLAFGAVTIYALGSGWSQPSLLGRYALILLPWAALASAWSIQFILARAPRRELAPLSAFPPLRAVRSPRLALRSASFLVSAASILIILIAQGIDFRGLLRLEGLPWQRGAPAGSQLALTESTAKPSDAIILTDLARYGAWRLGGNRAAGTAIIHLAGPRFLHDDLAVVVPQRLDPLLATHARVWLTYDASTEAGPIAAIRGRLAADRFLVRHLQQGSAVSDLFAPGPPLVASRGEAIFGEMIALTGWAFAPTGSPGGLAYVELHWQAVRPVDTDYAVFAHLIDGRGDRIGQHDGGPVLGTRPTSTWREGDQVTDRFTIEIPEDAAIGDASLQIGLYRDQTRLRTGRDQDVVALEPIHVVQSPQQ